MVEVSISCCAVEDPEDVMRAAARQHVALEVAERLGLSTTRYVTDDFVYVVVHGSVADIKKFVKEMAKPRERVIKFDTGIQEFGITAESVDEIAEFEEMGVVTD